MGPGADPAAVADGVGSGPPLPPGRFASLRAEFREEGARGALVAFFSTIVVFGLILGLVLRSEAWPQVRDQFLNPEDFRASFPDVLSGFWLDLKLFVVAQAVILVFAMLVAVIRNLRGPAFFPLRFLSVLYIDLFRGIPLLLVILLLGFGVPALQLDGVPTDPLFWGVTALVLSYSAYTAEVYRSGIESVHESQRSAAAGPGPHPVAGPALRRAPPGGAQRHPGVAQRLGLPPEGRRAGQRARHPGGRPAGRDLRLPHVQLHLVCGGHRSLPAGQRAGGPLRGLVHGPGPPAPEPDDRVSTPPGTARLEVRDLRKSFGPKAVLDGIDLSVAEHEVVALIGPSGCGKSTLLRCVDLLERIDGGTIHLDGELVSGHGANANAVRQRIGIVFQSFNLFPHMTVLANVTLAPRRVHGLGRQDAEAQAREVLDRLGLADKVDDYPDRLSGGQQQRAAIARALVTGPELLLLDEVTSALDPELVGEVLAVIRDLAVGGMTMVLATHEMGFARDVAHRVAFLHEGRVLEEGPPATLFKQPRHERTRQFLKRVTDAGRL